MRRSIPLLTIVPLLLWTTLWRSPSPGESSSEHADIAVTRQALPPARTLGAYLGPFRMEGAWQLKSANAMVFGYSALIPRPNGRLLAFNDSGGVLSFAPPGAPPIRPVAKWLTLNQKERSKAGQDVESVARDPATGQYWLGLESTNRIVRLSPDLVETGRVTPKGMSGWGVNTGAEAMTRLPDGRFVAIREVTPSWSEARQHDALLFSGDPIEHPDARPFRFDGPDNFSVVDMAMLPDGRALILMRRLLWPAPMRFAGRIVIADTARIRPGGVWHSAPLAWLASVLPVDNFEAIAVVPRGDGRLTVWVMSDDNKMRVLQRTLLWKLSVDPAKLPWPK